MDELSCFDFIQNFGQFKKDLEGITNVIEEAAPGAAATL
jgi:hypothetical protein